MWRAVPAFAVAATLACGGMQAASQGDHGDRRKTAHGKKERAVSLTLEQIAERVTATLAPSEKETSVVYLDSEEISAGASVQVGRKTVEAPWDAYMSFVDLRPEANWGHDCRYLLVNRRTGEVKSYAASFPPFLKGPVKTLRLIWKGSRVPDWAVAVR